MSNMCPTSRTRAEIHLRRDGLQATACDLCVCLESLRAFSASVCGCSAITDTLQSLQLVLVSLQVHAHVHVCVCVCVVEDLWWLHMEAIHNSADMLWRFCRRSFYTWDNVGSPQCWAASVHMERPINKKGFPLSCIHTHTYKFKPSGCFSPPAKLLNIPWVLARLFDQGWPSTY